MIISIVVAVDTHLAIGNHGDLLWRLPKDMARFKEITLGHHVLMGRKTYESIPPKFRPLPGRENIVLSKSSTIKDKDVIHVASIEEGIQFAKEKGERELMIIGGGEIYKQTIGLADRIYLTEVQHRFEADTFFPSIENKEWELIEETCIAQDDKNAYAMVFKTLTRKSRKQIQKG